MDVLAAADPSPRKEYMDWICRVYCKGAFLAEDAERVRNTLVLFHRWKHRLSVVERDIGRHKSEQSVWECVERFDPSRTEDLEPEGRELRRQERAKALAESEVCDEEGFDGWIAASPRTAYASRWWGRGTRWCTAMKQGTHFQYYSKSGPLRVFVSPDGAKFQAHVATGSCCDEQDRRVDFAAFVKALPAPAVEILKEDVRKLLPSSDGPVKLAIDGSMILSLPISIVPEDVAAGLKAKGIEKLKTLAENGEWKLRYAHESLSKWALGLRTAANHPYGQSNHLVLDREGGERMTADTSDRSVKPLRELIAALADGPEGFAAEAITGICGQWEAKNGFRNPAWMGAILETVGVNGIPPETWHALAVKVAKMPRAWSEFAIPEEAIDENVADALANGWSLIPVPEAMRTKRRLTFILSKHPDLARTEIPALGMEDMIDEEVAMAMVSYRRGEGLEHVPARLLTHDFIVAALAEYPRAVKHAPAGVLTQEICHSVVSMDGTMAMEVPREFRDRELFLRAVRQNGTILHFVPHHLRDEEICRAAIAINPDQFPHATFDLRYEDYLAGVAMSGSLLARVPLRFRDEEMCLAAFRKQFDASYHIPPLVGERLKARFPEEFASYRGVLSSRYKAADDPIREFVPDGEMPDALPPIPALAA